MVITIERNHKIYCLQIIDNICVCVCVCVCVCDYKTVKYKKKMCYRQKNNSKIQILKLLKDKKILKNQMIHCLKIIETKQSIYD